MYGKSIRNALLYEEGYYRGKKFGDGESISGKQCVNIRDKYLCEG